MTSTIERRVYAIPFPTLAELEEQVLTPLRKAVSTFEKIALDLRNVAGEISTEYFEVSLTEPPTLENLGTIAVFQNYLDLEIDHLQECAEGLRGAWFAIDSLRIEGVTREHDDA